MRRCMVIGKVIDLQKICDPRGNLTVAQSHEAVPFDIARAYWVYDVPAGECRGGHAHKECEELLIATSGAFHVTLDNGEQKETILLNHPYQALYIPKMTWRSLDDFSSGAVCLVLASKPFDEADYIREYDEFLKQR